MERTVAEQTGQDPIDPAMAVEWAEACNGIYRVLKRGRGTVGRDGAGVNLTESQVAMLESVAKSGPLPVGEIAQSAGLAQPTVTRMLNTLENREIVRRVPSARDDRVVLVELTTQGARLWQEKHALLREFQRDALQRFAPERRPEVVAMLGELVRIIEDQIGGRD